MLNPKPMTDNAWPTLILEEWQDTLATLHMWTQIVGKIRLKQTPLVNHWWNVPLYVSACGLTTSPMPYQDRIFEIEFDFWITNTRRVSSPQRWAMTAEDAPESRSALLEMISTHDAQLGLQDEYGQRYTVDFLLEWRGKRAMIRSGWIIEHDSNTPRLTTCYPF